MVVYYCVVLQEIVSTVQGADEQKIFYNLFLSAYLCIMSRAHRLPCSLYVLRNPNPLPGERLSVDERYYTIAKEEEEGKRKEGLWVAEKAIVGIDTIVQLVSRSASQP